MARVSGIFIKKEKNSPREELSSAFFRAGFGLEGDGNSGGNPDRQLCILRKEDRDLAEKDSRGGLCFDRFQETLQIEGLKADDLSRGRKLLLGSVVAEVKIRGKRCWPECQIIQAGEICPLARGTAFLALESSGIIAVGDEVGIISPDTR